MSKLYIVEEKPAYVAKAALIVGEAVLVQGKNLAIIQKTPMGLKVSEVIIQDTIIDDALMFYSSPEDAIDAANELVN